MKFLHTSDWHIGRTVRGQSRYAEQESALQEVLNYTRDNSVDCLLVAGDVFDTSSPSPESEELLYRFFQELHGEGIPAVVVAGNHDHPRRLDAIAPLLRSLEINIRGVPRSHTNGAIIELESRDRRERALVVTLPWVNERDAVDFDRLQREPGERLSQYSERVGQLLELLCDNLPSDSPRVVVSHMFVDGAKVGAGGGERALHIDGRIYGVETARLHLPVEYIALGHVHKPQQVSASPHAAYSGSLLQLDFGEREQQKYVNLVEAHARQPAIVTQLPISSGRRLVDIGMPEHGVALNDLARYKDETEDAWARVFVDVDMPVSNLAQLVRAELPNAVHVERARKEASREPDSADRSHLGPVEMFSRFYEGSLGRGHEPSDETLALFRTLLNEEEHAASEA